MESNIGKQRPYHPNIQLSSALEKNNRTQKSTMRSTMTIQSTVPTEFSDDDTIDKWHKWDSSPRPYDKLSRRHGLSTRGTRKDSSEPKPDHALVSAFHHSKQKHINVTCTQYGRCISVCHLADMWTAHYRAVSASKQDMEHDNEKDKATALVGRRRHNEEGSWAWRDTKKHSVGWNAVGGKSSFRWVERDRGRRAEGSWPLWSGRLRSTAKEGILTQVGLLLPLLALVVILVFFLTVAQGDNDGGTRDELTLGWIPVGCDYCKSITECLTGDEFELGTKATRRILACSAITPFPSLEMERGNKLSRHDRKKWTN
ncbi:hypothetical protein MUK42_00776 [Musa troglodytarum]|uniref:Uncharacterized protein n=1 Tax=Musa troglodytarum TaxID=320322 RepID=A0A9E7FHR0_9LILI|nr:hypothetical protein MUK42_00776 [Musa troglodytarum]